MGRRHALKVCFGVIVSVTAAQGTAQTLPSAPPAPDVGRIFRWIAEGGEIGLRDAAKRVEMDDAARLQLQEIWDEYFRSVDAAAVQFREQNPSAAQLRQRGEEMCREFETSKLIPWLDAHRVIKADIQRRSDIAAWLWLRTTESDGPQRILELLRRAGLSKDREADAQQLLHQARQQSVSLLEESKRIEQQNNAADAAASGLLLAAGHADVGLRTLQMQWSLHDDLHALLSSTQVRLLDREVAQAMVGG